MGDEIEVGSPSRRVRLSAFQPTRTMKSAWSGTLLAERRGRLAARAKLRSPMRTSPGIGAPRSIASAPCLSVSSRCEKTAAPEIVDRVQPPTGRLAAALAVATAVGIAQDASGPVHRGARRLLCQQAGHHGIEERHRLVEPLL